MSTSAERQHQASDNPLLAIFSFKQQDALIDYCAGLTVGRGDLLEIVLRSRAGDFGNYNYACHVLDAVPDELALTTDDLLVLSRTPSATS